MSADSLVDRRGFVAGCLGAAGLLMLSPADAATADAAIGRTGLTGMSLIIDLKIPASAALGARLARRGAACHILHGDRYRSVHSLLSSAEAPTTVAGISTYADFIVATGVLREARFAMLSYAAHSRLSPLEHPCFADMIGERAFNGITLERRGLAHTDADTVLSWVMQSRSLRRTT